MPLSCQTKEIILGSILGDGSLKIHKPYKNARFSFRHSITQKEYFHWKVSQLKEISSDNCVWEQGRGGNDGLGGPKLRYQSLALESLTELYHLTHQASQKGEARIRRKWLNMMTPLSLAIWWLDDGSLIGHCARKGVFCTDSFLKEDLVVLKRYLEKVWGIKVKIARASIHSAKEQYRLWIRSTETLKKFLRIILPHIYVEQMLPKVILLYKDSELQQRWISEIAQLTEFPESTIEKYVLAKKDKWKDFRE